MKKAIQLELYRAFYNPAFWLALAAGCVIAAAHFFQQVLPNTSHIYSGEEMAYPVTIFNSILPMDYVGFYGNIYYYSIPLLCVLPFGVSYFQDVHTGYRKNICVRVEKRAYLTGKYLAVFLSAGVICIAPLILNLMLTAAVIPALVPQTGTNLFAVAEFSFMSEIFYSSPFLYLLLYFLMDFVMAGTLACVALGASCFAKNPFAVLFAPFLLFFLLQALSSFSGYICWNPYNIMNPAGSASVSLIHLAVEASVFLLIGGGCLALEGGTRDVL